jgi:hypothetical protein
MSFSSFGNSGGEEKYQPQRALGNVVRKEQEKV